MLIKDSRAVPAQLAKRRAKPRYRSNADRCGHSALGSPVLRIHLTSNFKLRFRLLPLLLSFPESPLFLLTFRRTWSAGYIFN